LWTEQLFISGSGRIDCISIRYDIIGRDSGKFLHDLRLMILAGIRKIWKSGRGRRALADGKWTELQTADRELTDRVDQVLAALRELRVGVVTEEYRMQELIADTLVRKDIPFQKEYRLASRNRIDFYIEGGIGLEVKKGKPNRTAVTRQLERYASFGKIRALILVVERNVNIPSRIMDKPCILFGLNRLWGVALN